MFRTGSLTETAAPPERLAGLPLSAWAFGIRNWMAMCLALLVAFWLQLESASSAAVCVGILALPSRGQTFQKAIYRMLGTVVGVAASLVIAGLFNEQREFFILACAAWLGLCVFAAGLLDGNRAYGAVLSGYTVAIVALAQIDTPQGTFSAGVNRGAAEVIGILAVAFISNAFKAPDSLPATLGKLETAHRKTCRTASDVLRSGSYDAAEMASLLGEITSLHADIATLSPESLTGGMRVAAASTAVAAMVRMLSAVRAAVIAVPQLGAAGQREAAALTDAISGGAGLIADARRQARALLSRSPFDNDQLVATCCNLVLLAHPIQRSEVHFAG